jgi:3-oxoacyl-[acyl-carrier protein] reductase
LIDLGGRRVLVTGGSRGIGAACCRLFARAGASVLVHYQTRADAAAALLADLAELGGSHLMFGADLRGVLGVEELFAYVSAEWGGLDVLVNNAGTWVPNPLATLDAAGLADTLEINVSAPFRCAAAALPLLAGAADGCIVNITSTAGQRGEPRYSPYAASKGAMIAATRSWAVELAPRVRVNSVAPGWVDTDMTAAALQGTGRSEALAGIPLGRIASAEDVAGPVVFLASPLARHITGETLSVNGGSVLG